MGVDMRNVNEGLTVKSILVIDAGPKGGNEE